MTPDNQPPPPTPPIKTRGYQQMTNRPTKTRTRHRRNISIPWPKPKTSELANHLPNPQNFVPVFAGRHDAAITWRHDLETFAALIAHQDRSGALQLRWIGSQTAEFPTVTALAETLNAYNLPLDPYSQNTATTYQNNLWATQPPTHYEGTRQPNGTYKIEIVTPTGKRQELQPAPRDKRTQHFGPPQQPTWGPNNLAGALETARLLLDYTHSTTRTPEQLFNDARSLAISTITNLPPTHFTIPIQQIHQWPTTHKPIAHATTPTQQPPPPNQPRLDTTITTTRSRLGGRSTRIDINRPRQYPKPTRRRPPEPTP